MSIIIKNALLGRKKKDIYIEGNRIREISDNISSEADKKIDASSKAIIPSFMNSHTHSAMTLFRGYADDMEVNKWLSEKIWPLEARLTQRDVYSGSKLACLEMIKSGTTFFADMYHHFHGTAKAVSDIGMRAAVSSAFIDHFNPNSAQDQINMSKKLFEETKGYPDRIQYMLGPHSVLSVSEESLLWAAEFAWKNNLKMQMHVSESFNEVSKCLMLKDLQRPIEYLDSIGFLSSNLQLVQSIWVNKAEISLLKQNNVSVINCPTSNIKTHVGNLFPYKQYFDLEIPVLIGTDGPATNNSLDMFTEMKVANLSQRIRNKNIMLLSPRALYNITTKVTADAFCIDCGEIKEGKLADCLLLDLKHPSLVPNNSLYSNLVYSANGSCVDTTICDGRVLMENRKVKGEDEIIQEAIEASKRIIGDD